MYLFNKPLAVSLARQEASFLELLQSTFFCICTPLYDLVIILNFFMQPRQVWRYIRCKPAINTSASYSTYTPKEQLDIDLQFAYKSVSSAVLKQQKPRPSTASSTTSPTSNIIPSNSVEELELDELYAALKIPVSATVSKRIDSSRPGITALLTRMAQSGNH